MPLHDVSLICTVCHKHYVVSTSNPHLFETELIKENSVCVFCSGKANRVTLRLVCCVCKREFQTKVLAKNRDKYLSWKCPVCINADGPAVKSKGKTKELELDCDLCMRKSGVCQFPELGCSTTADWLFFGNGDLSSLKKSCSIFSVHGVDKERDDIHFFKYSMLVKSKYKLRPTNLVIIKQRLGSRANYVTNIIVFAGDKKVGKFVVISDKKYPRGADWVLPTKKLFKGW